MIRLIREEVTDRLFKVQIRREDEEHLRDRWGDALETGGTATAAPPPPPPPAARPAPPAPPPSPSRSAPPGQGQGGAGAFKEARSGAPVGSQGNGPVQPIRRDQPKVGRNDPCPCGSGKKYKKCHGENE
jgi:preprotein translocase subunit SecA